MNTRPKDSDEHYDKVVKQKGDTVCSGCGKAFSGGLQWCPHCDARNPLYPRYELIYIGIMMAATLLAAVFFYIFTL
jgi:hypothetical protein